MSDSGSEGPVPETATEKAAREKEAAEQAALPYRWTQTLDDVNVSVPVPPGTRSKMLAVTIGKKKLSVGLKGQEQVMGGELYADVKLDDSTWHIEDEKLVVITLEKVKKQTWWPHVLTHDPKIDTTKIVPENSKLGDLDGETRGMVEKMMQMGKPTSDEQKKLDMLKKFQEANPQLDFSNAKIN
ncbi:CS-domain-containing protein [Atractiella rhizophila]|nr:CS-domain-containing protein [Atractiella rhizophila]